MIKGIRYYLKYAEHKKIYRKAGVSERDVFLASFPKSGNTWLRFILARALYPDSQVNLRNIHDYFPTVHHGSVHEISKAHSPRYIKTHAPFFSLYPRCIYVFRDYRAVVVSAWFHAKNSVGFQGNLMDFVSTPLMNSFGPWHWHLEQAFDHKEKHPGKIHILQYEKILVDTAAEIKSLLEFCGIQPLITPEEIAHATSFGKLREEEANAGSGVKKPSEDFFFRSGKSDGWKEYITEEIESRIMNAATRRMMIRCGYIKL
jgi:estrone sulfotransferase